MQRKKNLNPRPKDRVNLLSVLWATTANIEKKKNNTNVNE